jgi:peptidoglycan/LPS O-acetylase OafA/YrhL
MAAMPHSPYTKRYGLFAVAIVLLVCGGFALLMGSTHFLFRPLGALACLVSVWLVKLSRVHAESDAAASARNVSLGTTDRPRPAMWALGVVSLIAAAISYLYLYKDALDGYHEILPVYCFAAAMLVVAVIWGYLAAKLLSGKT